MRVLRPDAAISPAVPLVVMASPADFAPGRSKKPQNPTDHNEYDADRPQDGDARKKTDEK
jgi:hypothetical protein